MKNVTLIFFVIVGLLFSACQQSAKTDDPENLKTVLTEYFNGIKTKDFQKMKDLTTNDFVLFEDGKVFNNDSLFKMMNSFPKYTVEYTFDNMTINVDNKTGNMRYFNRGEFVMMDTMRMTNNWLESATFKKVDDTWKLEFLHSTVRK
jgi:hypothetical protein